jgi:hypothetical protein
MLQTLHIFINYVIAHWPAISALVGGGAGLSVALQWLLHKTHIDSKKVAYSLIHLFSIAAALSAYYLDNTSVLPAYAGLAIAAQTVHRFAVSPYYNKYVLPYLNFLSEQAKANPVQSTPVESQPLVEQTPAFVS